MTTRIYTNTSRKGFREYRAGVVTQRPWTSNNPYTHDTRQWSGEDVGDIDAQIRLGPYQRDWNSLYEKFRSRAMGEGSQLLTAAAEWKSSMSMIANRAIRLRRAFQALRRFDLPNVGHHLAMPVYEREIVRGRIQRYNRLTRPTEGWLEYWMGWAPLMGDIGNAVHNVCNPYPDQKITVGLSRTYYDYESSSASWYAQTNIRKQSVTIAAYGKMKVTNHNLYLANQLGLLNPAQTLWEVVPFSFIADWTLNVGKVLGSLTDFAGTSLSDTGTAMRSQVNFSRSGFREVWNPDLEKYIKRYYSGNAVGVEISRQPGTITPPRLGVKFDRISLTRASTAVSLLSEAFASGRKQK